jgi:hypothetical protein
MSDPVTKLDAGQVLQLVLDEENRRLRTDTTINTENLVINVSLNPEDDGVHIADKDSGESLKIENNGSINTNTTSFPELVNIVLANANTEYFYNLPTNTRKITIRARKGTLRLGFQPGSTDTAYLTISKGMVYNENDINFNGSVFIQSNRNNEVIEVLSWS